MYSKDFVEEKIKASLSCDIKDANRSDLYKALLELIDYCAKENSALTKKKRLFYFSAEFLIGKLLSNNLINLGIYDSVKEILDNNGILLSDLEEYENEPSLGNGGLGRLAACFLDSMASMGLQGDGIGLHYHFGLFHQNFVDNKQKETKDIWLDKMSWAKPTDICYDVNLAGKIYKARMFELLVTGYEGRTNTLRLFDLDTVDESIVEEGINFNKKDIAKNLTLFLYPDDSDDDGKKLRLYQQYLMVSAGAQYILEDAIKRGSNLYDLSEYVAIQINDTHPSMVIPELI
ncbi:MAG: glycogen/starch/alpha-glucan phosphorylase, partial [Eubacterium sp.]|nr:glycogen/starch/alpha-glucan phosphorylase [Eubacterium sp.]